MSVRNGTTPSVLEPSIVLTDLRGKLFIYRPLVRHIALCTVAMISPDKDKWTRRRVADTLLTDEWLSAKLPNDSMSFIAIKDCGGGGLPGPTDLALDQELLEVLWTRSSVDKSIFGCDDEGRVHLRS